MLGFARLIDSHASSIYPALKTQEAALDEALQVKSQTVPHPTDGGLLGDSNGGAVTQTFGARVADATLPATVSDPSHADVVVFAGTSQEAAVGAGMIPTTCCAFDTSAPPIPANPTLARSAAFPTDAEVGGSAELAAGGAAGTGQLVADPVAAPSGAAGSGGLGASEATRVTIQTEIPASTSGPKGPAPTALRAANMSGAAAAAGDGGTLTVTAGTPQQTGASSGGIRISWNEPALWAVQGMALMFGILLF
jgi:hypothetical protein